MDERREDYWIGVKIRYFVNGRARGIEWVPDKVIMPLYVKKFLFEMEKHIDEVGTDNSGRMEIRQEQLRKEGKMMLRCRLNTD